ncbi:tRNA pseudouridine(55) synthase TruB [Aliifodinibius salipaludis]|uniref:tRNA pseudouridine synthase B n=1 Tax=Fodinibius salipaludis TaxID=2032627 RepID=A0A2A2GAT3_9BACT|nr:tRNA pseudouridine(55) synthase TruB [Aliifodinibius salipaludis]PAU93955.1 tRNA pseudouridine(55) synthase TruB [Aliifodinibius salipaludis]
MPKAIPVEELPIFSNHNLPDPNFDYNQGAAFLIKKPKRWSSFQVVKFLRKCTDIRKIGHAGTLDPMATGLLILCCGDGTRTVSSFQEADKEYIAEITFGSSTPSLDAETTPDVRASFNHLSRKSIKESLDKNFSGLIVQIPPMYSALKHEGDPLYKLARKGKEVKRKPRQVIIEEMKILECNLPRLQLHVKCSKGTYIRTLADDLANSLDTAGHLTGLRRIAIGKYKNEDALTVEKMEGIFSVNNYASNIDLH